MKSPYPTLSWLLAALALALLGAWGFLAYQGFMLRDRAAAADAADAERTERTAYLATVKGALRQSEADLAAIDGRFVGRDDVPDYITALEGLASREGVTVAMGSINLDEPSEEPVGALRLRVSVSGSWQNVTGFVARLESMPYASSLSSLSFTRRELPEGQGAAAFTWTADMDLVTQVAN